MTDKSTGSTRKGGIKPPGETDAAKRAVVDHYGECGTLLEASKRAGQHYSIVRMWRDTDPAFALALQQADDVYVQAIEEQARRIVFDGKDPKTTMFMLRCLNRDKYGDTRRLEHSGPGGMPIAIHSIEQVKAQLVAVAHQFPTIAPRLREGLQAIIDALPKED